MPPFCAKIAHKHKKINQILFDKARRLSYAQSQMQSRFHHRHLHHHRTIMPADCHGLS